MRTTRMITVATVAALSLGLAACGDSSDDTTATATTGATTGAATPMAPATTAAAAATEFGPGCASVPVDPSNAGSFQAMAKVPVATAASGNPLLTTLVTAVKEAGLVDSLNSSGGLTVFAPTDAAFKKLPEADLKAVLADKKKLTDILTYHAVAGRLSPAELAGKHETLEGKSLNVTGSGESFMVDGASTVVCGNVQTANATVYIIDTVLMPEG